MAQPLPAPMRDCARLAEALHAHGMTAHTLAGDDGIPGVHVAPADAPSAGYDLRCQPTAAGGRFVTPLGVGIATVDEAVRLVLYLYGRRPTPR
jgi:hypothetical protein